MPLVLVVDDDEDVRPAVVALLESMGHRVLSAASGAEALAIIECEALDVLVTDVVMPGMSGYQLAEQARQIRPDLPIVCMTGFSLLAAERPGCSVVLRKPFRAAELKAAISGLAGG
jgi:CheY-like chemotaxis protein